MSEYLYVVRLPPEYFDKMSQQMYFAIYQMKSEKIQTELSNKKRPP